MRREGCTLIGRNGDEYYFTDSVFEHDDGFKGVTGFMVRPVSPEEWEYASDPKNVAERFDDVFDDIWDKKGCAGQCESTGRFISARDTAFRDWIDSAIRIDGIKRLMFDDYFGCGASDTFERLGIEFECTDCNSCGRIFSAVSDYEELYNLSAWVAVRSLEAGHCSADWAADAIFGKNTD